jgi:hypothetical protein
LLPIFNLDGHLLLSDIIPEETMRIIFIFFLILSFSPVVSQGQQKELEKLTEFIRSHRIQVTHPDSVLKEHSEVVWITLAIKDSTVVSADLAFTEFSWFKLPLDSFVKRKIMGYKFGHPMLPSMVLPLMLGYFTNKNALEVKRNWELLSSLRTGDLSQAVKKQEAVIWPVFHVIGTYAPPFKVKH